MTFGIWRLAYLLEVQEVSPLKMESAMPSYLITRGTESENFFLFFIFFISFQQGVSGLPGANGIPGEPGQLVRTFLKRLGKTYIHAVRACVLLRSNL